MRPRALIDLLHYCRSHAVNLGHEKIEVEDIRQGEEAFSTDLVANIGFEIRDVFPEAKDILYELIELPRHVQSKELTTLFAQKGFNEKQQGEIINLLLWYGVLGFVRDDSEVTYIYSVKYDMKKLKALIGKKLPNHVVYYINPAFWRGLEIR